MIQNNVYAGLDIGGTGVRIVIMQGNDVLASTTLPTALFSEQPGSQPVQILAQRIHALLPEGSRLTGVGIGASGPVYIDSGIIDNPHTLPAFSGFSLTTLLEKHLQVPVRIDNDAMVAALGEYYLGAGVGSQRMLMVTLGTGVGVALLDNGKPFRMADGSHPEAGHIPIGDDEQACYCGLTGCWETLAARSWLQAQIKQQSPELDYRQQTLEDWQRLCNQYPSIAVIFHQYGRQVGRGLSALLMAYGPDTTVLSGSASALYPLYEEGLQSVLQRTAGFEVNRSVHISALGDMAGAMGATRLITDSALLI